jgi:hypothetical protein
MESFNLQNWTRIDAMNRTYSASFSSAPAERSADGALVRGEAIIGQAKAASRSACRRTPNRFSRFMERPSLCRTLIFSSATPSSRLHFYRTPPASLSSIDYSNKKPTRYGQVEQRADDVSSTLRSSFATEDGAAELSFFCRQDAGSTLRCAERGTLPPSPTASQSSKNLAQSLSNEINDLVGWLDLQPKGRREVNQACARGGDENRSKLRRQILVPEPFFPTSA